VPAIQVCQKQAYQCRHEVALAQTCEKLRHPALQPIKSLSAAPARTVPPTPVGCSERSRAQPTDPFGLLNRTFMSRTVTSSRARPDSATGVSD
jgi:hypothetical protein